MKWFFNLKISKKLLLSFACVLVLSAVVGIFSIMQLEKVNQASTEISTNWLPSIQTLAALKLDLARLRSNEAQMALYADDPDEAAVFGKRTEQILVDMVANTKIYEGQISEPEERAVYPEVKKDLAALLIEHGKIMDALAAKNAEQMRTLFKGISEKLYFSLLANLQKLTKVNADGGDASSRGADLVFSNARAWIIALLSISMIVGVALALFVARIISVPLSKAVQVAKRVAGGDLSADIRAAGKDETGQLMDSLKDMNDSLLRIVGQVRLGTDTIATASGQIASGNLDLSSRTEEQASSLEETASALEELTATVKQNSDNARQASQLAVKASQIASEGGDAVGQVVHTMSSINDSSKKIVDIISVIDGIAFQTNILALNAAVEAARAGEQGRGFAVVASEVRSLAQRSAAAAKEIKFLIDDSVEKVSAGSRLVENAGKTMVEVVTSVKSVTDIGAEIAAASQEQSVGIEEINRAVTQMDEVTQQNAALVEQAAAAAQSLQDQAETLAQVVGVFKLNDALVDDTTNKVVSIKTANLRVAVTPRKALEANPRQTARSVRTALPPKRASGSTVDAGGDWETF